MVGGFLNLQNKSTDTKNGWNSNGIIFGRFRYEKERKWKWRNSISFVVSIHRLCSTCIMQRTVGISELHENLLLHKNLLWARLILPCTVFTVHKYNSRVHLSACDCYSTSLLLLLRYVTPYEYNASQIVLYFFYLSALFFHRHSFHPFYATHCKFSPIFSLFLDSNSMCYA